MEGLIKSSGSKYDEYEKLIIERDQLNKECGQIWTVYLQKFGQLESDLYEEKIECIKCKKTIAYYQNAINHGGIIDANALNEYLEQEMAEYYLKLKEMLKDNENAKNAGKSSPYQVKRSKELYRRLAKLIHPDLNPLTDSSVELQELWQRALIAYHKNDVKELSEIEVLARKVLKELGAGETKVDIPDIDDKIAELKKEIETIENSEPYTLGNLVEDESASEKKIAELKEELESYKKYHKELGDVIIKLMAGGGIQIYVE